MQAIILYVFYCVKCLSIKQIKTNRELRNAATFASVSTNTTTALPVGRLARETTPVSPSKLPVKSVRLFQMNSCSPPPPPPAFSSLSLKTPAKSVPPTPGTALQNKIQKNLEKSLGDSLNIHLQQQMGSFQASMLEAFQSLREELATKKKVAVESSWLVQ